MFQKESGDENLEMYLANSYWCVLSNELCYNRGNGSKTISMLISKLSVLSVKIK